MDKDRVIDYSNCPSAAFAPRQRVHRTDQETYDKYIERDNEYYDSIVIDDIDNY